jgi:NAD(P)-dependent dehydrogenase (short-subunit alcohol dehydrogenase family)
MAEPTRREAWPSDCHVEYRDKNHRGDGRPPFATILSSRSRCGGWVRPEDVASAMTFLASEQASWITGQTLPVTGGLLRDQSKLRLRFGGEPV